MLIPRNTSIAEHEKLRLRDSIRNKRRRFQERKNRGKKVKTKRRKGRKKKRQQTKEKMVLNCRPGSNPNLKKSIYIS